MAAARLPGDPRVGLIQGEIQDLDAVKTAMEGVDTVFHLASNPDIARKLTEVPHVFHFVGGFRHIKR
jgi:nucleoside-diphosphate-sugar epimerase